MEEPDFEHDENVIEDCPKCGRTYDDADADFLICHHCGYDAEKKTFQRINRRRSMEGYGINPDVSLDW